MMLQPIRAFVLTLYSAIVGLSSVECAQGALQAEVHQDHTAWVAEGLKRMQTIKPGMTRESLLTVFQTEGGLSTGLQRTFVSRECPYFKVDVEFKAVGRPDRDATGRVTLIEDGQDIILKISKPYLQFSNFD